MHSDKEKRSILPSHVKNSTMTKSRKERAELLINLFVNASQRLNIEQFLG